MVDITSKSILSARDFNMTPKKWDKLLDPTKTRDTLKELYIAAQNT